VLRLDAAALASAGVQEGDLLAATEGGALTIDVRCAASCTVRTVAMGDPRAHGEGHLVFVAEPSSTPAASPGAGGPTVAAVPTGAAPSGGSGGKIAIIVIAVVVVVGGGSLIALRRRGV